MATALLDTARTPHDSHWKCHQSPASALAATKTLEMSTQGGTWPPAQLGNDLGVILAALHLNMQPFGGAACV